MTTSNSNQPPSQPQSEPTAQHSAQLQSNGQQQSLEQSQQKKGFKWGITDKTGWEWLNLIGILLVPLMIGVLTFAINFQQSQISQQQFADSQKISSDQQQETALATYLDYTTNLILKNNLLQSKPNDEIRVVAWVETLTVLRRINPTRKDIVLRFLFDTGLIQIISLQDSNLSGVQEVSLRPLGSLQIKNLILEYADLTYTTWGNLFVESSSFVHSNMLHSKLDHLIITSSYFDDVVLSNDVISNSDFSKSHFVRAELQGAILNNVSLRNTDLSNANLSGAKLTSVDFSGADLTGANLEGVTGITIGQLERQAKSLKGATMPDGKIHS